MAHGSSGDHMPAWFPSAAPGPSSDQTYWYELPSDGVKSSNSMSSPGTYLRRASVPTVRVAAAAESGAHFLSCARGPRPLVVPSDYPRGGRGVAATHRRNIRVAAAAPPRFVGELSARRAYSRAPGSAPGAPEQ